LLWSALQEFGEVDGVLLPSVPPSENVERGLRERAERIEIFPFSVLWRQAARRRLGGPCAGFLPEGFVAWALGERHRWCEEASLISRLGDLSRYDLVVSRYLSPALVLGLHRHPRLLIDVDDYDPDRLRLRLKHASPLKQLTLRRCLSFSGRAHADHLPRAAHCWISHPADRRHPGLAAATLLPNIPYFPAGLPECSSPPISPPVLLFVGTLSYSANSDGLDAFLSTAWPAILHARPDARLRVVGLGMSLRQRERWKTIPGVEPIGFLEKLGEAYDGCRACIAPLQAGAGTNIKVLEAAAYGRACVVTPVSHRGFEETLPASVACLRADSVADMVHPCLRLLDDAGLASELGQRARKTVELHYTPTAFAAAVRLGIERAMETSLSRC
jgi:glycosyltransferase involved in cell wall biosynthesis